VAALEAAVILLHNLTIDVVELVARGGSMPEAADLRGDVRKARDALIATRDALRDPA
jgi:hypothetical protein